MKKTPKDMIAGTIHETNNSGCIEILEYESAEKITVRFLNTGFEISTLSGNIRSGKLKDKLKPSVCGVGFVGVGSYSKSIDKICYTKWNSMLSRCYSHKSQKKFPTYIGCTVHKYWHNFQNFAKWFYDNYPNDGEDYQLDKDIKTDGNKVYSHEHCTFVTHSENVIKSNSKSYLLKDPDGNVISILNMKMFCIDNNLSYSNVRLVVKGDQKYHKGWTKAG